MLKEPIWNDDQNLYVGILGDEFWWYGHKFSHIIVSVHKGRGQTEGVWFIDGAKMVVATEKMVNKAVVTLNELNRHV